MEEEGVSYETLQELLRAERRSNKMTPLPNGFWAQLQAFLREIEEEFRQAQARDPFDRKVMMLTDRIKNARHASESVWTLRERKLAMLALAHVKDHGEPDGLTKKEADLYAALLSTLRGGRRLVFQGTAAEQDYADAPTPPPKPTPRPEPEPAPPAEPAPTPKAETRPEPAAAPAEPAEPAPEKPATPVVPPDTGDPDQVTIRALGEIPPFVGPDMDTYHLQEGDVATVPRGIADLLVKRGKAAIVGAV